jgi:adenylate cyclase
MVRGRDGMAILVATLLALALAIVAKDAHLFDGVEDQTVAMRFEARGAHTPSNVAVIAIDDVTFSDLARQWPFPRSLHARAIDALRKAGAPDRL